MGFVATAVSHVRNMTLNFGKTCMPWGQKRSVWAGCSGAGFVLPGIFALRPEDPATHVVLAAFALQAVLSVMSDYVTTGRDSVWHGLDRWMSSGMTVFMIYFAHNALSPLHCLIAFPPLTCLYRSKRAIARADWGKYVVWHTLWHIAAVGGASYVMFLENGWVGVEAARGWIRKAIGGGEL